MAAATNHKDELARLGIRNIHTWYSEMEKAVERINKEQEELQQNVLLEDNENKTYSYKKYAKNFRRKLNEINEELNSLEQRYNLYLPHSIEDIDDDFKIFKVNEHLNKIITNLNSKVKNAFELVFKQHFKDTLSNEKVESLKSSVQKDTEELQKKFEEYYIPRLKKIDPSIKDIKSAIKYLQTSIDQFKEVLNNNGTVEVNLKTAVKELGDTAELKEKLIDVYTDIRLQVYLDSKKVNREDLKQETIADLKASLRGM